MSLYDFWAKWASGLVLAIKYGLWQMAEALVGLALGLALAVLEHLGIQYGPRVAR